MKKNTRCSRLLFSGLLAVLLAGGMFFLWMKTYKRLDGHLDQVSSLTFFPHSHNRLVSSSLDGRIGIWNIESQTVSFIPLAIGDPTCLSFSPNGKTLVVGIHEYAFVNGVRVNKSEGFKLIALDWETKKTVREVKELDAAPTALIHSNLKPYLVSTSISEINIWNTDTWERIAKIDVRNLGGIIAGFVNNSDKLVFANSDGSIGIYDIIAQKTETFQPLNEGIIGLACREDETTNIVVLTKDNLYTVDLVAKKAKRVVTGFEDGMSAQVVCYSEKTNTYAVGVMELGEITFRRARVILFDGASFAVAAKFTGIPGGVKAICVSDDGTVFACAGFQATIRLLTP
jgi:WD40 repeat protein